MNYQNSDSKKLGRISLADWATVPVTATLAVPVAVHVTVHVTVPVAVHVTVSIAQDCSDSSACTVHEKGSILARTNSVFDLIFVDPCECFCVNPDYCGCVQGDSSFVDW